MTTHEKGQIAAELFAYEETGMVWQPVESSQIAEIGYDASTATLGIKFPAGKRSPASEYHYANVTPEMHREFMAAESIGSFFGQTIKGRPDLYPFTKIEAETLPGIKGAIASFMEDHSIKEIRAGSTVIRTNSSDGATKTMPTQSPASEMIDAPSTALAVIDTMADDLLFTPGAVTDAQLAAGRDWYLTEAKKYDISTEKARTEFKRFARPLQKLRTGIEARAKELTGATKRKIAAIDAEKRRLVMLVGGIEQEVLRPLTDYEAAEDARIEARNAAIKEIQEAGPYTQAHWMELPAQAMRERLAEIESDTREWPELGTTVDAYRKESIKLIKGAISAREEYEKGKAELAKLRAEAESRAEQDRLAAVAKGAQEAAVEAERKRVAAQAAAEQKAAEVRAADEENRNKVSSEIIHALTQECLIDIPAAETVLDAIVKGLIPHITIQY